MDRETLKQDAQEGIDMKHIKKTQLGQQAVTDVELQQIRGESQGDPLFGGGREK